MTESIQWWMPWALWVCGEIVLVMSIAEVIKNQALKPVKARWAKWRWTMRAPSLLLGALGLPYAAVYLSAGLLASPLLACALASAVGGLSPLLYDVGTKLLKRKAEEA